MARLQQEEDLLPARSLSNFNCSLWKCWLKRDVKKSNFTKKKKKKVLHYCLPLRGTRCPLFHRQIARVGSDGSTLLFSAGLIPYTSTALYGSNIPLTMGWAKESSWGHRLGLSLQKDSSDVSPVFFFHYYPQGKGVSSSLLPLRFGCGHQNTSVLAVAGWWTNSKESGKEKPLTGLDQTLSRVGWVIFHK